MKKISRTIESADAVVTAADKKITSSASSLDTKIGTLRSDFPNYQYILSSNLKQRISMIKSYNKTMWNYVTNSEICVSRMKTLTSSSSTFYKINETIPKIESLSSKLKNISEPQDCKSLPELQKEYQKIIPILDKSILDTKDDVNAQNCADVTQKDADNSVILASALPNQIDPPVILFCIQLIS